MPSLASPAPDRTRLAVGALLVAGLLWGLTWMPFRYFGSQGLNGITFTMMSYGLIGLLVLPWLILRRADWRPQARLVTMIGLAGGGANVCFASALMAGEVVRVMLLFYLAPIWGVLGGRLAFGEPITHLRLAAVDVHRGEELPDQPPGRRPAEADDLDRQREAPEGRHPLAVVGDHHHARARGGDQEQ